MKTLISAKVRFLTYEKLLQRNWKYERGVKRHKKQMRMAYTYLIRAPVGTKRNNNKEAIFKEIIADNFSQ